MSKPEAPKTPLVPMNLRVPDDLKYRFKVWCAENRMDMTQVLVTYMRDVLAGKAVPHKPKPHAKPPRPR